MEAKDPKPKQHELTAEELAPLSAVSGSIVMGKARIFDLQATLERAEKDLHDAETRKDALLVGIATARGFTGNVRLSDDGKRLTEA